MRGKAAFLGFLALQAIVVAIWAFSLLPLTVANAPPFISTSAQIWSGGAEANVVENWRQQTTTEMAAPFKPYGPLLYASLLMLASAAAAFVSTMLFAKGRVWLAAAAIVAALALGAGAAWFIVQQWNASTLFPPGFANTGWLYMSTRALLMQMLLGYVLLVVFLGLVIADVVRPGRTLGFGFIALNWLVVAGVWLALYLGFFLIPGAGSA